MSPTEPRRHRHTPNAWAICPYLVGHDIGVTVAVRLLWPRGAGGTRHGLAVRVRGAPAALFRWRRHRAHSRQTRGHPAYLEEPTCPCCIPALGEFSEVPPRGVPGSIIDGGGFRRDRAAPVASPTEDSHSGLVRTIGNRVGDETPRGFKSRILRHGSSTVLASATDEIGNGLLRTLTSVGTSPFSRASNRLCPGGQGRTWLRKGLEPVKPPPVRALPPGSG